MELPKREPEIRVDLNDECHAVLETLTSRELAELMDDTLRDEGQKRPEEMTAEEVRLRVSLPEMVGAFDEKVVAVEGVTVDGDDFDASNPDHLDRIPAMWKVKCGGQLVQQALLSEAERKN